ncbi:MAG: nucleotidyltransferase family protein [Xanthomonadales bacterium]|nr:nucleotidyltransferase family protein [Xanthomonadales bacterium]
MLAGTHSNPRRLVKGRNKAFLDIEGRPLVRHVVDALVAARRVDRIYVVGPEQALRPLLADVHGVRCVPQQGKFVSNGWAGVHARDADTPELTEEERRERPLLLISCDLPLISGGSVDDFVGRCEVMDREAGMGHAMFVGVAENAALEPFYGTPDRGGMERPLVQMQEGLYRLSNIYVSRPYKLQHSEFLQTSFNLRKAKDWHNVAKLIVSLFSQHGGWFAAWMTVRLQLTAMLRHGQGRLYHRLRAGNTFDKIDRGVSTVLGGAVRLVDSPYGGLSLDVDDEVDYTLLRDHYVEWMAVVRALDSRGPAAERRPASGASEQGQGEGRPEGDDEDTDQQPGKKGHG